MRTIARDVEHLAHHFLRHFRLLEGVTLEDAYADWCEAWGVDYEMRTPIWERVSRDA